MLTTTPAVVGAPARPAHGLTFQALRPALRKAGDFAMALLYRFIRSRIEVECGGPARLVSRRQPWTQD